jgi:hypothetical protein
MKLVFGVVDVAYSDATTNGKTTTGEVAELLEKNYAPMRTFYELNQDKIADVLAESVSESINAIVNGAPPTISVTYGGEQQIEGMFRTFIFSNTMQKIMDKAGAGGVVSMAAQNGTSSRKKAKAKRKPRPAFVDSGLYVQSFRAWIER